MSSEPERPDPASSPGEGDRGESRRGRAARAPGSSRAAVLGAMVVALSLGMLALAGTTPRGVGRPAVVPSRVTLDQRTFTCTGGIDGAQVVSGSDRRGVSRLRRIDKHPIDVVVPQDQAAGAFAAQMVRSRHAIAWGRCPEPASHWWFVGAGGAAVTHRTVLTVANPRTGAAVVDVKVFGPDGEVEAPGLTGLSIPAGGVRRVRLSGVAPKIGDLAVTLSAGRGLVSVSAADRFPLRGVGSPVNEWLPAQPAPARTQQLVGLLPGVDNARLVLVNPTGREAVVRWSVVGRSGSYVPKGAKPVRVKPRSVRTVPVGAEYQGDLGALMLTSDQPVTATVRQVFDRDVAYATGVDPLRGQTTLAVPPSGRARLVLSAAGASNAVQVTGFDVRGRQVWQRNVTVKDRTARVIDLSDRIRFVRLVSSTPDTVAGIVSIGRGVAAVGATPTVRSVKLPAVRLQW